MSLGYNTLCLWNAGALLTIGCWPLEVWPLVKTEICNNGKNTKSFWRECATFPYLSDVYIEYMKNNIILHMFKTLLSLNFGFLCLNIGIKKL